MLSISFSHLNSRGSVGLFAVAYLGSTSERGFNEKIPINNGDVPLELDTERWQQLNSFTQNTFNSLDSVNCDQHR